MKKIHFMTDVTTVKKKSRNANSDMRNVEQDRNANSTTENVAIRNISFLFIS